MRTSAVAVKCQPSPAKVFNLNCESLNLCHSIVNTMASPIPRFLLPTSPALPSRSLQFFHRSVLQAQRRIQPCRHVTGSAAAKPGAPPPSNVLGKPDKFRPPSHSSRQPAENPFGSKLTEAQKKRKYPHIPGANPEEGTFMYWFLSNTDLHLFITLVSEPGIRSLLFSPFLQLCLLSKPPQPPSFPPPLSSHLPLKLTPPPPPPGHTLHPRRHSLVRELPPRHRLPGLAPDARRMALGPPPNLERFPLAVEAVGVGAIAGCGRHAQGRGERCAEAK